MVRLGLQKRQGGCLSMPDMISITKIRSRIVCAVFLLSGRLGRLWLGFCDGSCALRIRDKNLTDTFGKRIFELQKRVVCGIMVCVGLSLIAGAQNHFVDAYLLSFESRSIIDLSAFARRLDL